MIRCEHCQLPVFENEVIYAEFADKRVPFCCHGCKGVYEIINTEGLTSFYEQRQWDDNTKPKGKELFKPVQINHFEEFVKDGDGNVKTINIYIDNIRCAACVWLNEKILLKTKGIISARVNYASHNAFIVWDSNVITLKEIIDKIVSIGYQPKPYQESEAFKIQKKEERDLLIRFGTAVFLSSQLMVYTIALYAGYFQDIDVDTKIVLEIIALILTTPVIFYSGLPFIKNTINGLRHLHFNMDTLITVGSLSAYFFSIYQLSTGGKVYFDTSAMIVTLILLGRYIEATAKSKATEDINRLYELLPTEARLVTAGQDDTIIPVKSLSRGHRIRVLPGERIPTDAIVVIGETETDESMITGESKPIYKTCGSLIIGGSINLNGSIVADVLNSFDKTMLSDIIRFVKEAQSRKPNIQNLADKVVGFLVPIILTLATLTGILQLLYSKDFTYSLMTAISVVVIACPCSLGLATPLAILIATTKATQKGLLIKGGNIIEKVRAIDSIVFDKTGTLTKGSPMIKDIILVDQTFNRQSVLQLSASLERHSEHCIAKAICESSRGIDLLEILSVEIKPGRGIRGLLNDEIIAIGNRQFMLENGIKLDNLPIHNSQFEKEGNSLIFLSKGASLIAILVISDILKEESVEAIKELKKSIGHIHILSGDNTVTTNVIASKLGISSFLAEMMPQQKQEFIRNIQSNNHKVMMIGDGINDAPSLKEAYVGVSMAKGTTVAMESADIVLTRDDLRLIPMLLSLSYKTYRIIRQNIFMSFIYNILAVPIAMIGLLHPIIAATAMAISSICVVTNSLRIRKCGR